MKLKFEASADGSVSTDFTCSKTLQGYPEWLHGGIASSLLDSAMANCLFANGAVGATGELSIRFRDSVKISKSVHVKAWLTKIRPPLFLLDAELAQDGQVVVTASGKFMGKMVQVNLEET